MCSVRECVCKCLGVCSLVEISLKEPLSSSSLPQPLLHVDPVSGLLPSVPRDFQIFINLVDLCRSAKETLFPSLYATSYSKYCTYVCTMCVVHVHSYIAVLEVFWVLVS